MADKPKFVAVTDPAMADELTRDPADLSMPVTFKPNGHLWVDAAQFEAWRAAHDGGLDRM
jgi:hypothetical protein